MIRSISFNNLRSSGKIILAVLAFASLFTLNISRLVLSRHMIDFGSFYESGRAARVGLPPYAVDYPLVESVFNPFDGTDVPLPNLNLPSSLYLFIPISLIDPATARTVFLVMSAGLYVFIVYTMVKDQKSSPLIIAWLFSLTGLWKTLELGQIYVLILAAYAAVWLLLARDKQILAGMVMGFIIAIKPSMGVWVLFFLISGYYWISIAAIVSAAVVSLLAAFSFGISIYSEWLIAAANFHGYTLPDNNSIIAFFSRLGMGLEGTILSIILVVALAAYIWKNEHTPREISDFAVMASLLASPITWTGYTLFLIPAFMSRKWTRLTTISAVILVVPNFVLFALTIHSDILLLAASSFYGIATILLLLDSLHLDSKSESSVSDPYQTYMERIS